MVVIMIVVVSDAPAPRYVFRSRGDGAWILRSSLGTRRCDVPAPPLFRESSVITRPFLNQIVNGCLYKDIIANGLDVNVPDGATLCLWRAGLHSTVRGLSPRPTTNGLLT